MSVCMFTGQKYSGMWVCRYVCVCMSSVVFMAGRSGQSLRVKRGEEKERRGGRKAMIV